MAGNCDPRQKAVKREVQSDRPTKGQRFYTCARNPSCKFFLWEDQALERQRGRTTEDIGDEIPPRERPEELGPAFTQRRLTSLGFEVQPGSTQEVRRDSDETTPPSSPTPTQRQSGGAARGNRMPARNGESSRAGPSNNIGGASLGSPVQMTPFSPSKRKRTDPEVVEDVTDLSDMDSEGEAELAELADQSAKKYAASRDKGKGPEQAYETPSVIRTTHVEGLPTPTTNHRHVARTLFPDTSTTRHRAVAFDTPGSPSDATGDISKQVLALLSQHSLPASTMSSVSDVLAIAARRIEGITRGRDTARETVRRKEEELAQMQERIRALENKERMYEAQVTNMKAGIMRLYQEH